MRRGAFDYLEKPYDKTALLETINRALQKLDALDTEIISASPKMESVKRMILKVARSNSTVLIRGESGTGKELIAVLVVAVTAGYALDFSPADTEYRGHFAFTGAHAEKKGLFEIADRGTLFLDEIAELDVAMQAKLLRALQERKIRRVGGTHRHTRGDLETTGVPVLRLQGRPLPGSRAALAGGDFRSSA